MKYRNQSKVGSFFSHPVVGILGSVASLVGLALAVYFYYASIRSRDLAYYLHPIRTSIVSAGGGSSLQVRYGGQDIKGNVSALQFAIWNAGDEPIRHEDILERITVVGEPGVRILEAKTRQLSREVTKLAIDSSMMADGKLTFDWKILEKNDGAAIQIMYEGPPNAKFSVIGSIVGQRAFSEKKNKNAEFGSPEEEYKKRKKSDKILSGVMFAFGCFALGFGLYTKVKRERSSWQMLVQGLFMLGMAVYLFYRTFFQPTPFNF